MPRVKFVSGYDTTSEIMTGVPDPLDRYRRTTSAGREEVLIGRRFVAEPGDEFELTDDQVAWVRRDSPGALEDRGGF